MWRNIGAGELKVVTTDDRSALALLGSLEGRRKELGMSMRILAERSGLGERTVQRVLSGREPAAKLSTVLRIADAMRVELQFKNLISARQVRQDQALRKAAKLAQIVQGNSALEAQAVSKKALQEIMDEMADRLIAGSRRRLWA